MCPQCGAQSIIRGKAEFGGGYICWQKKGGCGRKFSDGDRSIESQEVGNKPNPEIYDLTNSILKIANKRAKIAACLNATSAHEFFTQDREAETVEGTVVSAEEDTTPPPPGPAPSTGDAQLDRELAQFANLSRKLRLGKFQALKNALVQLLGETEGIETYYRVLKEHHVEHAWQFKSMAPAKQAFTAMFHILRAGVPVEPEPEAG